MRKLKSKKKNFAAAIRCWLHSVKRSDYISRLGSWEEKGRGQGYLCGIGCLNPPLWISNKQMNVKGLPILFLGRGIESSLGPHLWTLSHVSEGQTNVDKHTHWHPCAHMQPCYFGHYTLRAKWWLSALIVFARDWCLERSFLTTDKKEMEWGW